MNSYLGYFALSILVFLLYFVVLFGIVFFTASLSLNVIKNTIGKNIKNQITKRLRKKIFTFTIISYLLGILGLFIMFTIANGDFTFWNFLLAIYRLISESVFNPQATFFFIITFLIVILSNTVFNYFIVFRKVAFSRIRRFASAIIVSILTAPYLFLFGINDVMISLGL